MTELTQKDIAGRDGNARNPRCHGECRIVAMLFVFVAMLFPLAAGAQEISLDLWHAYRGDEAAALQNVVDDFQNSHKNIHVNLVWVPDEVFPNKVFSGVPQGSGPDAFIFAHDVIGNWADAGIIADLAPYVTEAELNVYHESTVNALRYTVRPKGGEPVSGIYAIPLAYKTAVLFYNKDTVENPPKTTSELLEYVKAHTVMRCADGDADCTPHHGLVYDNKNLFFHGAWLHGFGGHLFDDAGHIDLKNDGNVKSIEFAKKLGEYIPSDVFYPRIMAMFLEGTADMVINGPWFMAEISNMNRTGLRYGVATMPKITEPGAPADAYGTPFATVEGIYMARETKQSIALVRMSESDAGYAAAKKNVEARRAATVELMKYVASDGAYRRMIQGRQMVANKDAYAKLLADRSPEADLLREVAPVFLAQLDHAVPVSNRPEMGSLWMPMMQALDMSLSGMLGVGRALDEARLLIVVQGMAACRVFPVLRDLVFRAYGMHLLSR